GAGLPLEAGDAPLVADGAYDVSRALTVRAGVAAGRGQPISPFVGLLERGAHFGGTLTVATRFAGVSGSYANAGANAQFSAARSSGVSSYAVRSSVRLRGATLDVVANAGQTGDRDLTVALRLPHHGFDLFGGFETARVDGARWSSPVVGIALPLMRGLDLEGSLTPVGTKTALRISLVAGFTPPHRPSRAPIVPLLLRSESTQPEGIIVYVDGFRVRSDGGRVDVTPGRHLVRIESVDALRGSPDREIDAGNLREVALPLWPFRTISGRVIVDAMASLVPRDFSLTGIAVLLEPGGIPASVDDAGRFTFPSVPVAPDGFVQVDEGSLPPGFGSLGRVEVGTNGDLTVRIAPARHIEKTVFPGS
nr:hypothetical protein [Candidatus Eremiobacteraeota bacterium]